MSNLAVVYVDHIFWEKEKSIKSCQVSGCYCSLVPNWPSPLRVVFSFESSVSRAQSAGTASCLAHAMRQSAHLKDISEW